MTTKSNKEEKQWTSNTYNNERVRQKEAMKTGKGIRQRTKAE